MQSWFAHVLVWECYVLACSDAGGYDTWVHAHAAALIAAVQRAIGGAPLRYVLCKLTCLTVPHMQCRC